MRAILSGVVLVAATTFGWLKIISGSAAAGQFGVSAGYLWGE